MEMIYMLVTIKLNEEVKREYAGGARSSIATITKVDETEKAYQFEIDRKFIGYKRLKDGAVKVWVPKSQCRVIDFDKTYLVLNDKYKNIQGEFGQFIEQYELIKGEN
jgi:hypothetical protein